MDRFKSIFIVILFIISGQFLQAGASRVSTSELEKLREAYSGFLPEYKVDSAILYSRKILDFHDKEKLTDADAAVTDYIAIANLYKSLGYNSMSWDLLKRSVKVIKSAYKTDDPYYFINMVKVLGCAMGQIRTQESYEWFMTELGALESISSVDLYGWPREVTERWLFSVLDMIKMGVLTTPSLAQVRQMLIMLGNLEEVIEYFDADGKMTSFLFQLEMICHYRLGEYDNVILTAAMSPEEEVLGVMSLDSKVLWLASLINGATDKERSLKEIEDFIGQMKSEVRRSFLSLSASERKSVWNTYSLYIDMVNNALLGLDGPASAGLAYDMALFTKGLLLDAEKGVDSVLSDIQDPSLKSTVRRYRELGRHVKTSGVATAADRLEFSDLERKILQSSPRFAESLSFMTTSWKDIVNALGENEMAVEFVMRPMTTGNSPEYLALVLTAGSEAPRVVRLFTQETLDNVVKGDYLSDGELAAMVWNEILDGCDGVDNIFFSPDGSLYNLPVENIGRGGDGFMSGKRFIRVSSTKAVIKGRGKPKAERALVLGGLDYDEAERQEQACGGTEEDPQAGADRGIRDFPLDLTDYRRGFSYLPATKAEADTISRLLGGRGIEVTALSGKYGTEREFRKLAGDSADIIHIATHGFYLTNKDVESMKTKNPCKTIGSLIVPNNDASVSYSGLLFSGANSTLKGEAESADNDGILTADEASLMDLGNTGLVVLSACQTGLGEISRDGVIGLQRGFKKAGANSLLISLWSVHDKATRLLMTRFYESLLGGMGKQEALRDAQSYVRDYETEAGVHPYVHPKYWASFILLDALD